MAELSNAFVDVPEAIAEMQAGRMVVVVDDEDRENEGDLTLAAEFCTPEAINFMAKYGRGLICLTLTEERADALRLPPMTQANTSRFGTAFTESIEAREGVTTGISAADRSHTIQVAISPGTTPNDLARPGHVFPLRARKGGVLVRAGQTEASVDLARMAGLIPAGVILRIMNEDGTMARVPDLVEFCKVHGLRMLTVAAKLIRYRLQNERYVHRVAEAQLPTALGEFRMIAYESEAGIGDAYGSVAGSRTLRWSMAIWNVRSERASQCWCACIRTAWRGICLGRRCAPAGRRLRARCARLRRRGAVIVYLHHTQRGLGVDRTVQPPRLAFHRSEGRATGERSEDGHQRVLRQVGLGGQILSDLGVRRITLLSNHPTHVPALQGFGIEIVGQTPIPGVTEPRLVAAC